MHGGRGRRGKEGTKREGRKGRKKCRRLNRCCPKSNLSICPDVVSGTQKLTTNDILKTPLPSFPGHPGAPNIPEGPPGKRRRGSSLLVQSSKEARFFRERRGMGCAGPQLFAVTALTASPQRSVQTVHTWARALGLRSRTRCAPGEARSRPPGLGCGRAPPRGASTAPGRGDTRAPRPRGSTHRTGTGTGTRASRSKAPCSRAPGGPRGPPLPGAPTLLLTPARPPPRPQSCFRLPLGSPGSRAPLAGPPPPQVSNLAKERRARGGAGCEPRGPRLPSWRARLTGSAARGQELRAVGAGVRAARWVRGLRAPRPRGRVPELSGTADLTHSGPGKPRPLAPAPALRRVQRRPAAFPGGPIGSGGLARGRGPRAGQAPGRGPGPRRPVSMAARKEGLEGGGCAARGHPSQTLEEGGLVFSQRESLLQRGWEAATRPKEGWHSSR